MDPSVNIGFARQAAYDAASWKYNQDCAVAVAALRHRVHVTSVSRCRVTLRAAHTGSVSFASPDSIVEGERGGSAVLMVTTHACLEQFDVCRAQVVCSKSQVRKKLCDLLLFCVLPARLSQTTLTLTRHLGPGSRLSR